MRHILYPVSAALTSIFRMDSNSTSFSLVEGKRCEPTRWSMSHTVGCDPFIKSQLASRCGMLSGGQKRRVSVALALLKVTL